MKRIFLLGLVLLLILSMLPAAASALTDYGTVVGGWLRLRSAPSLDATIIKSYYTGTVVKILGASGDWYNVEAPDGYTGYMVASYINLGGSGGGTTAYVTSANGYGVRMRTGPSKGYRVLAVYSVGTKVTVLQTGVIWSRIQVGTTVGYMMSEFLTSSPSPTTPPSGDMATVWSSNGYGVRLRSGPGTNYSIIGLYSVGTRVAVQTRGTDWDYILVGSRLGYMMNEFLIYDHSTNPIATGITVTADYSTGMQGEYVDLDVTVTGSNLSNPAYTLDVDDHAVAEIVDDDLHIFSSAPVGTVIEVTATTTDEDSGGNLLTDTCTVTVTAAEPRVTSFAFDETTATVSIAGGDVQRRVGYTISGYNLTSPYFTLAVSSAGSSYVTTSIDETSEEIVLDISSTIPDSTVFTVTGTTTANDVGGNPKTAVLTVTITDEVVTLTSIVVTADDSTLRYNEITDLHATLYYSDGSYISDVAYGTQYIAAITSGSAYASISTDSTYVLVPNADSLIGVADQTVVITGTAVENTSITGTCEVLLYGRNAPDPPTLTSAVPADGSITFHWTAPADDGGEALTYYKAYWSATEEGVKTPIDESISTSLSSYEKTGLVNGTEYYIWMMAANNRGNSEYSNYLTATPTATVPSAPLNLNVSDRGNEFVTIEWDEPSNTGGTSVVIDHYLAYVDGGSGITVPGTPAPFTATFSGLTNAQDYTFSVLAVNSVGNGPLAEITSNPVGYPDAPTIGTISAGFREIAVAWAPAAYTGGHDIVSYDVYYKELPSGSPTLFTTVSAPTTNATITGLTNADYEVWIRSFNDYYTSDESTHVTPSPSPYTTPGVPQDFVATGDSPSNNQITVSWNPPAATGGRDITQYKIEYSPAGGGSPVSPIYVPYSSSTISQLIDTLAADTYSVSVSATNDGTNYGPAATNSSVPVTDPL